jgi:hypothetical protein
MRKRKKDIFDKPWVTIATIVGIIAVVAIALVFFWGNGGSVGTPSSGQAAAGPGSSTVSAGPTTSAGQAAPTIVVVETTTQAVPQTGVRVHVSYLGGYKGTYGMPSGLQTVQSSGDRYFEIVNATGSIQASFQKLDSSTKHALTVEIYKDGSLLTQGSVSTSYGTVTLAADVTTGVAQPAQTGGGIRATATTGTIGGGNGTAGITAAMTTAAVT